METSSTILRVPGFYLGHTTHLEDGTGCTVIICPEGATGGVDVRGGAPATRETDLLSPEETVQDLNAVVLSGGSAFGLAAASGVAQELEHRGIGLDVGVTHVPIVASACIFDLDFGNPMVRPSELDGISAVMRALDSASEIKPATGNVGAGTGATVGKMAGPAQRMKGGLGIATVEAGPLTVTAVVAVNALGTVVNPENGTLVAGTRVAPDSTMIAPPGVMLDPAVLAQAIMQANEGLEDKTDDAPTPPVVDDQSAMDSVVPAAAAPKKPEPPAPAPAPEPASAPAATPAPKPESAPTASNDATGGSPLPPPDPRTRVNTTIACLVTNAKLTKAGATKLAQMSADAYAHTIYPTHTTNDGDTIFVMAKGDVEVPLDFVGILATRALEEAIVNGCATAETLFDTPGAATVNKS